MHSPYNTLTYVAVDIETVVFILYAFEALPLVVAVKGDRWMLERSPYYRFPYSDAEIAMVIIRKGLFVNPSSLILNRRMGICAIAAGEYHEAIGRLEMCLRRSKDHPMLMIFLGIAVIGAGNEKHGAELIEAGAGTLTEAQLATLEKELAGLFRHEKVADRVWKILNPPLRSLDQWESKRIDLGLMTARKSTRSDVR